MAQKSVLGVELTDQCIRLVCLKLAKNKKYQIEFAVEGNLEKGSVVSRTIVNIESVVESFRKLISHYKIKNKKIAIAIDSRNVISKTVEFDESLSERDIEHQLEFDSEKHIPDSSDDVCLDFQILGASESKSKQSVLVVATHKEPVDIYSEIIDAAGLSLEIVDVYHYVLLRVCESIQFCDDYQYTEDSCLALVDLDFWRSQLTIIADGNVQLQEDFKFKKKVSDAQGVEEVVPWYKRHLQIFSSNNKNREVDCIVLYGENAKIDGVEKLFGLITGKPVHLANPFAGMTKTNPQNIDEKSYKYLISAGLALREVMS